MGRNERSADCQDFLHILAFTNISGRSVFSRCFKYWDMFLRLYFINHLAPKSEKRTNKLIILRTADPTELTVRFRHWLICYLQQRRLLMRPTVLLGDHTHSLL